MYLLTETASPFALERWAAFFANFGQFAKGFFYTLGISIGALIVALLLGLIFGAMSSTHNKVLRGISTCLCRNLPEHTLRLCNSWLSSMGFQS